MPIRDLETTHIRLLASLFETRNLAQTARAIGLSPSAASHALAKARKVLGDPLFISSREGLVPTPYGDRISNAAKQALEVLLDGMSAQASFDPSSTRRSFSVYLSQAGQIVFLPRLIKLMQEEAPDARIRVLPMPLDNPGGDLASGEVDLAVGFVKNLVGGFHSALLRREQYVCVVRRDDPRFASGMTLASFRAAPHVVAESRGRGHTELRQKLEGGGVKRNTVVLIPEGANLAMLVADSDLIATVPMGLATYFASRLPLKILPAPIPLPTAALSVYWHERYHRDPANQWFRNAFIRLFREPSAAQVRKAAKGG
jgi:DNA-binding transcriptional LysR family regulator